MRTIVVALFLFSSILGYSQNLIRYVDPMIGTAKMGRTFPGLLFLLTSFRAGKFSFL